MVRYYFHIALTILFCSTAYSQVATPFDYTDFLGLRLYASGANAGADSLNQNLIDLDTGIETVSLAVDAVEADVYTVINTSGGIIDGTVMFADLATSTQSVIVRTTTNQSIAGNKTLTDYWFTEQLYPSADNVYRLGHYSGYRYAWMETVGLGVQNIYIRNTAGTDSAKISFTTNEISFDKDITFADTTKKVGDAVNQLNAIYTDSVKSSNDIALNANHIIMQGIFGIGGGTLSAHTIGATDSVTIVPTSSFVYLNTTATTSISYISPSAITPGLIYIITTDGSDSVTLLDGAGNMQLEGNFVMDTASDVIVLMKSGTVAGRLIELFRSNNE